MFYYNFVLTYTVFLMKKDFLRGLIYPRSLIGPTSSPWWLWSLNSFFAKEGELFFQTLKGGGLTYFHAPLANKINVIKRLFSWKTKFGYIQHDLKK